MLKKLILSFLLIFCFSGNILAQDDFNAEEFQKYNPDGQKFEFVKDYLTSLTYIHNNVLRQDNLSIAKPSQGSSQKIDFLLKSLIADNISLRVAKNTLKKYQTSQNGLILKVKILFDTYCDEMIAVNNRERQLLQDAKDGKFINEIKRFDQSKFLEEQAKIASSRPGISANLLEASMLVKKILISANPGRAGAFNQLAVTKKEKRRLLSKVDEFFGVGFQGDLRPGQNYLEASVVSIREILEDNRLQTISN